MQRRKFSREFKVEAVKLVSERSKHPDTERCEIFDGHFVPA